MQVTINTTKTFDNILNSTKRITQHIGGTRSGKTYAILQYLIFESLQKSLDITVVRKTIPQLKKTVIKDFKDILVEMGVWKEDNFNITDRIWKYNDTQIQFISTDDADKLRGIKSDILFIDEASEIDEESYFQLSIRTTGKIILAYNPTVSPFHWLRQMVDCDRYITTYKDNPYLDQIQIKAIEELEHKNKRYWLIYGKGEFAPNEKNIYQFEIIDEYEAEFVGFGLDFGFSNDPTALVAVYKNGNNIYATELLYEKGLVTKDIIERLKGLEIEKEEIWCDSADPRLIEEIYRAGFNAKPVKKGHDSIRFGINTVKNYKLHVDRKSQNLINELYSYQYASDKNGYITDTPEGGLDHLLDALRYVALMKLTTKATTAGKYVIGFGR
jgi:phage terminase large subunit